MRLAFCAPWSRRSAIARVSELVVTELEQHPDVEVTLFQPDTSSGRCPPHGCHLRTLPQHEHELAGYEHVVYQYGDQPANHGAIAVAAQHHLGTAIVHDLDLRNLWYALLRERPSPRGVRLVHALHPGVVTVDAEVSGTWNKVLRAPSANFLAAVTLSATALITHSRFAASVVRGAALTEPVVLPLPWRLQPSTRTRAELGLPDNRVVIMQTGVFNDNKCIDVVLRAVADGRLGQNVHVVVAGLDPNGRAPQLRQLAADLGIGPVVEVRPNVGDGELNALLANSDVATVLRQPCLEAASASLVEAMLHGLAVITVDAGSYAELPSDVVCHIAPPLSPAAVAAALRELVEDPEGRVMRGRRARDYARRVHDPSVYATRLLEVLAGAGTGRRRTAAVDEVAAPLALGGFDPADEITASVADAFHELFGRAPHLLPAELAPDALDPIAGAPHKVRG